MISEINRLKIKLEPLNERLKSSLTTDSSVKALNIALLDFLMKHTSAPDRDLVKDLVLGMPLTGDIAASECLRKKQATERVNITEVIKEVEKTNRKIISNLYKQNSDDQKLCFDLTVTEIEERK